MKLGVWGHNSGVGVASGEKCLVDKILNLSKN